MVKFITLTFKDNLTFDTCDVDECNKQFMLFIKRLRRRYGDFKYIVAIEFQDKNDRGAVHYHMMADLPYIKSKDIEELWGLGFINIRRVENAQHSAVYVGKYMKKGLIDDRLFGKKKYWGSRNLIKPKQYYNTDIDKILTKGEKKGYYENRYFSEYHKAWISYEKYFLD